MFDPNQIRSLKKANATVDAEKVKERVSGDFKAASKEEKQTILELSGITANAFYNTGKTGVVSPKAVLALSQVTNVTPYWYTGEIDDREPLSDKSADSFYEKYSDKAKQTKRKGTAKGKKGKVKEVKETKEIKAAKKTVAPKGKRTTAKVAAKPASAKPVSARGRKPAAKPQSATTQPSQTSVLFENSAKLNKVANAMELDDAIVLLKALFVRAEMGGKAEELCNIVKKCLLS